MGVFKVYIRYIWVYINCICVSIRFIWVYTRCIWVYIRYIWVYKGVYGC